VCHNTSLLKIKIKVSNTTFSEWFDGLGRPAMIPAKLKNDVMEEMRLHVDPAGISIWQLDRWIASQRRKSKYALGIAPSSRKKTERTEEQICTCLYVPLRALLTAFQYSS